MARSAGTNKKRVLFILPSLNGGGAQRSSLYLLRYLDKERFQPMLFVLQDEGPLKDEIPYGIPVEYGLGPGQDFKYHFPQVLVKLLKAARSTDLLVGCLPFSSTYAAVSAGIVRGIPVISWVRNNMTLAPTASKPLHRRLAAFFYPRVSRFVAISEGVADSMQEMYGIGPDRMEMIYNTLPVQEVQSLAEMDVDLDDLCPGEGPLVIAVGRMNVQKNFPLLLQAHRYLIGQGFKHRLLILGKGREYDALQKLISILGINSTVFTPGYVKNPFAYMRRADLFVLSSNYEGLSRVVLEALAVGVPVVSTDCPSGPREILQDGRCGVLVPVNDAEALAQAIYRVLNDPQLADELRSRGLQRAQDFLPEKVLPQVEELLLKVLGSS